MRYPPDLIAKWAGFALTFRTTGDQRWSALLINLSARTNMSPRNCELMIENLAGA